MTDEITAGRSAARALAARAPGWMVWYGERTGSLWAVPRTAAPLGARLLEAATPQELEQEIRRHQGAPLQPAAAPAGPPATGSAASRHRRPGEDPGDRRAEAATTTRIASPVGT
ncbi:hypothetical protein GCM10009530_76310 [Microbispora corallina]|uniref:Uncharacterized protein n=1 Tax=Microbispora corallina TaxID=83302 RepID=A0ABQ4GBT3_9ACTN|nr:hypothetical protein [Microbispora corallina]GIH44497.1 hypothetical protein Mco01_74970 [Microbispora corallina]